MEDQTISYDRSQRKRTRSRVLLSEKLAHFAITLGGIGTIVAILLVGVFLLAVALPLFRSPVIQFGRSSAVSVPTAGMLAAGLDESGGLLWFCSQNQIEVLDLRTGETLLTRASVAAGLKDATSIRSLSVSLKAAVGYRDGSMRIGRLGLESSFVPVADVPPEAQRLEVGEAVATAGSIYLRNSNKTTTRVELVTDFSDHLSTALDAPIVDIDLVNFTDGSCLAALDAKGRIRVEKLFSQRNLLTDEVVTSSTGATIPPRDELPDRRFLCVSGLGDQLFVFGVHGEFERYLIRNVSQPEKLEQRDLIKTDAKVTALARLFGGAAIVIGDSSGVGRLIFMSRDKDSAATDGRTTVVAKIFLSSFSDKAAAITAVVASPRSRLFGLAFADGAIRLFQATNESRLFAVDAPSNSGRTEPISFLLLSSRENRMVVARGNYVSDWKFDPGYPEVSLGSLFGKLWYENYPQPVFSWETTGHDSFEPKLSLVPLVFGTIKATVYSMLFATPLALMAAIYTSQFMHPHWRSWIKPTIEMMASLPSVVLGFLAGLIFAPIAERHAMILLSCLITVPMVLLLAAYLWQLWPPSWRNRLAGLRFPVILLAALPTGLGAGWMAASFIERHCFGGDLFAWLDGRGGSGWGGWMIVLLPISGIFAVFLSDRFISPWLRLRSRGWSHHRTAVVALATCLLGFVITGVVAWAAAMFLDSLRLETRGAILGTYVQRNAVVVAIGMSFAIIPLIYTIADDALSSVPDHLRSGSLGAGATPWQTAVRVIMPAAASGIFSAVMIGLGRAVGETMIVLMAAGNTPLMGWNMFNGFQTLSAAIATELPEAARGSSHYRVLFLAAVLLFAMTFVINTLAEVVRQRFRRRAHEL